MGNTTEHVRESGVHFYPWGLSGKSETITPRRDMYTKKNPEQKWQIKSLKDVMASLGHEGVSIEIRKHTRIR